MAQSTAQLIDGYVGRLLLRTIFTHASAHQAESRRFSLIFWPNAGILLRDLSGPQNPPDNSTGLNSLSPAPHVFSLSHIFPMPLRLSLANIAGARRKARGTNTV